MNTSQKSFVEHWSDFWQKMKSKEYEDAFSSARDNESQYSEYKKELMLMLLCSQSALNKREDAMLTLQKALDEQLFWSTDILDRIIDRSLKNIKDEDQFKLYYAKCDEILKALQKDAKPIYSIELAKSYQPEQALNLIVALHWRGAEGADLLKQHSSYLFSKGYSMLLPQSSQVYGVNEYCWDDYKLAVKEIQNHYNDVNNKYKIEGEDLIWMGASQGGGVALKMMLQNILSVDVNKFILLFPSVREKDVNEYISLLKSTDPTKGVYIYGEKDPGKELNRKIFDAAIDAGHQWKWIEIKGLHHNFPENMDGYFKESLDFLNM